MDTLTSGAASAADKVDCLVVVGAESKAGLEGISRLVSEDVYNNLNVSYFNESISRVTFVKKKL